MAKIKNYICMDCGTECKSPQDGVPLLMIWANGHNCDFTLVGEFVWEEYEEFVVIDGQTYHLLGDVYYN